MNIEAAILKKLTKNLPKAEIVTVKPREAAYFHKTPGDKLSYVRSRLQFMKQPFLEVFGITNFLPINHESIKEFYTFGMVTSLTGAKIEDECYLCNTEDGSNALVKLNLENLDRFSLYNGQIIAVKGRNIKGDELVAESLNSLPIINVNSTKRGRLCLLVARGAFSEKSLERVFGANPRVVILFGPFLRPEASTHGGFASFLSLLENKLKRNMHTSVVLVPSLEDNTFIKVFPQPVDPDSSPSKRILIVPNPSYFYINNHLVCVINYDSLLDLSSSEHYKEPQDSGDILFSGNRNMRLAHYLVLQRSFAPVFPSRSNIAYGEWLNMEIAPDLLLTSSKLKPFSSEAGPSTVVNIGSSGAVYHSISSHEAEPRYAVAISSSEDIGDPL